MIVGGGGVIGVIVGGGALALFAAFVVLHLNSVVFSGTVVAILRSVFTAVDNVGSVVVAMVVVHIVLLRRGRRSLRLVLFCRGRRGRRRCGSSTWACLHLALGGFSFHAAEIEVAVMT